MATLYFAAHPIDLLEIITESFSGLDSSLWPPQKAVGTTTLVQQLTKYAFTQPGQFLPIL